MATTTTITSSYAGQEAGQYIAKALFNSPTLANGTIDILPNIKYRRPLRPTTVANIIADATCDFTPTGTVTVAERILEPKYLQVNTQHCKADFQDTWDAVSMGYSAHQNIPPDFQSFIIAEMIAQVAQNNETSIWQGDASNSGEYDGLATLVSTDADLPASQEIAGTTVTASNVIDELGSIVDAMPTAVHAREDKKIYVADNIYRAYLRALGGFGANGLGANGYDNRGNNQALGNLVFDGVEICRTFGLADNTAMASYKENFKFGTGLLSDHNEVKIIDMADIDGSQNFRFIMRMTGGVQYAISSDIVTYGIVNSAN